ncbi:type II toxin-antitoxin system VapC family toxin [Synechococcus sp. CS-1324]|uniref:type II toxin-antitoxin system VapC family toxin n=1 Tax=unclassified Synechococcus TaxID=2626047 RepID=UPI000DB182E8|nr:MULTISPECIES: type II toxin-antitoxin system VapC family toxin [unclassified Synechococcus]MCT0213954.1 type II toxin-antitoxin system VapC family toxin [Synechococcus sp. CS-1326]MCT0230856.1 type II toxin-antitoxin system VapC family toxin [Synechococcus sp. CS-1324]MCT0233530.1 type II toxin-antitoxin system VapC family toxin [Synechococcus sp. CS-1327]PZV03384.1 MAG: PIN domain nuclease [Cyanobium sp.]
MAAGGGYLLDTCVLLWWLSGDQRLSREWEERLCGARCLVSAASIWEAAIKHQLGKLPVSPQALVKAAQQAGFALLAITPDHAAATALLPPHHKDPFDRLLIAQARSEGVLLLSDDRALKDYGPGVMLL